MFVQAHIRKIYINGERENAYESNQTREFVQYYVYFFIRLQSLMFGMTISSSSTTTAASLQALMLAEAAVLAHLCRHTLWLRQNCALLLQL